MIDILPKIQIFSSILRRVLPACIPFVILLAAASPNSLDKQKIRKPPTQYTHGRNAIDGPQRPQYPNGANGGEVDVAQVLLEQVLRHTGGHNKKVEPVPRVRQVSKVAGEPECHYLDYLQCA